MGESSSIRSDLVSGQAADSALQENQISTSAATAAERHLNSRSRGKGKGSAVAVRELHGSSSTSIIDNLLGEGRSSALPRNIVEVPVKALRCNPRNARRHSTKQIECLTASIRRFGFKGVIVIAPSGQILAGHARFQAAKLLELERMPCLVVTDLDDPAMRAFSLADNRLAEQSEWDEEVLKLELAALESLDLDFGLELTGFDTIDIDRILGPRTGSDLGSARQGGVFRRSG